MHIKKHILLYLLVPLFLLYIGSTFVRFVMLNDYVVVYEGACDPQTESCFVGCDDDECTEEYYYSKVTKYAPDLLLQCGEDITDCENANRCLVADTKCSVEYCDPEVDVEECALMEDTLIDEPYSTGDQDKSVEIQDTSL